YSIRAVAAQLGIDRRTVRRYLNASECPLPKPRGKRSSILDPYRAYILTRWREGCHNAAALYREIVGQGFQGGITIVKDFVKTLRSRSASEPVIRHVRLGPKRLRRWFAGPPEKLGDEERRLLGLVLDGSPELREAYALLQAFRKILEERNTAALRSWLEVCSSFPSVCRRKSLPRPCTPLPANVGSRSTRSTCGRQAEGPA